MDDKTKATLIQVTKDLTQRGKLVEAGWVGLQMAVFTGEEPEDQVTEMRRAFFAGALHLFQSINAVMEEGAEATESDLMVMDRINDELEEFEVELRGKVMPKADGHG